MTETAAATFCATLADEWGRAGVTDVVVSPGSRSTPLALAVDADPRLRLHVHLDERSASFTALGIGLATGRPAVMVTTSGTAAVECHPAVVEAHQAGVPLIVATADRPPELRDVGAPQTIDQTHLFGHAVRWFADPGVPDPSTAATWRSLAARSVAEATGAHPGPVHLNLPFRDPLVGDAGPLPSGRADGHPWHRRGATVPPVDDGVARELAAQFAHANGVIVAGGGAGEADAVHLLAETVGWPVLADPRSGCRLPRRTTVARFDLLLRHAGFAELHRPEVVLRLGAPPASKVLGQWLDGSGASHIAVDPTGTWWDPDRSAATVLAADPGALCRAIAELVDEPRANGAWLASWAAADRAAGEAIDDVLAERVEATEPALAMDALAAVPDGGALVASSSMPVRDVEWFAPPRAGVRCYANRGANGIDGVVSTAVGVALAGSPTVAVVGDVAFLHDTNGLLGAAARGVDLTVVVPDNDGGGIFSFLPQAIELVAERFERLFGTPHGVDPAAIAAAHGAVTTSVTARVDAANAIRRAVQDGGLHVVVVRTDRRANVVVHDQLNRAVSHVLDRVLASASAPPA